MSALVEIRGVVKRYGSLTAVPGIDLEISEGEFLAIMGPSGCGKTTTLRMLAGLEAPTEGEILIGGQRMNDVPPHERDTPLVWQSLALFPFLSARENVEFGLRMRGVRRRERRARALDWLERLGIAEFADADVGRLSGGQRQRVALARSLVTEPRMLLLDEPLSALDAHLVIRMQGVLTRLQRDLGITFVYVTHSQSEAFAMADRVVIMDRGRIAQTGTAREIYRAPASRFVAEFVGRNNIVSGAVRSAEAGHVLLDTGLGPIRVAAEGAAPTAGSPAEVVIAADLVRLGAADGAENTVTATVISEEFVGSVVTLFLEAADGEEFKVQIQERALAAHDLSPGQPITLSWAAADAHLLPEAAQ